MGSTGATQKRALDFLIDRVSQVGIRKEPLIAKIRQLIGGKPEVGTGLALTRH